MRSVNNRSGGEEAKAGAKAGAGGREEDRTGNARIRDAAIALFGQHGFDATTVRQIAERAGVSPALVIHHFGSKAGLRAACDQWVVDYLMHQKSKFAGGGFPSARQYLDDPEYAPIGAYLQVCLRAGGPTAEAVFDHLTQATVDILRLGAEGGTMRELPHLEDTAAILVAYSSGVAMLNQVLARHLGGTEIFEEKVMRRYGMAALDLYVHGLLTDDRMFASLYGADRDRPDSGPDSGSPDRDSPDRDDNDSRSPDSTVPPPDKETT